MKLSCISIKWAALIGVAQVLAACSGARTAPSTAGIPTPGPVPRGGSPVIRFVLDKPPAVGTTAAGQEIALGGFSGLR
ncbi:MAG: hypothetical protein EOP11_20425, partial [Proteobacteria bacterium]